jgi:enamine deaminase RidA (YjgF/YER057c/UK114 family)
MAGGQTLVRTVDVLKDPKIKTPASDLAASTATQIRLRDDINTTVAMANRLEVMRKQIEDLLKANAGKKPAEQALTTINQKMLSVELQLLSKSDLHSDDKWYVEAYKIYMNLLWLSGEVGSGAGDVAGAADFRPTDASLQVLGTIEKDLAVAQTDYAALIDVDVPAFNRANPKLAIK